MRGVVLSLPIAYVVFDLIENASVLVLLANYPERMNALAASLPYTTLVKRAASLLALVIPLVMLGFRFIRPRRP
jgi:formate-dependent nitrite reductase membrane component NrfD